MTTHQKIEWLLRLCVAFAFLYPPISAWINPYAWVGYFPSFAVDLSPVPEFTLLHIFGVVELVIGLYILIGKKIVVPSLAAAAALFFIVGFNFSQMDVLFRDLSIALAAIALALLNRSTLT